MDTRIILQTSHRVIAGGIAFPEVVGHLVEAGVEYYHVDYVGRRKTYYGVDGDVAVTPLTFENLPPVAEQFSAEALRAAILDSQKHGQAFRDFSRRAMQAGVQGYTAYLAGRRVVYNGRRGDQHTEWFPSAQPRP